MTSSQRRVHRIIWTFLAPLLLLIAVWLYAARPPSPHASEHYAPGAAP